MMTEMKLPACYAVIDENEMTYLDGGATIADSDAYKAFLNVGQVFNQLARAVSTGIRRRSRQMGSLVWRSAALAYRL